MLRRAVSLVAAIGFYVGLAQAQVPPVPRAVDPDFSIRGKIIFGTPHGPDQRIEVRLEKSGMQVVSTGYSDGVGNFEFRNLQPGTYWISINLEGFEEVRQQVEVYSQLGRIANISIFLNKKIQIVQKDVSGFLGDDPDVIDVTQMNQRYPKKAVQEYEKAIEENRKGESSKAMKRLEEALRIAPDFYHAHNNLGVIYQKFNRYRDAEQAYRRARELNPRAQQPLVNLGSLFIQESDSRKSDGKEVVGKLLDDAMDVLEPVIKTNPRSAIAYYYLGAANYKSAFYEEAEMYLKKAHDLDPAMGPVRLMLANVYMKQMKWDTVLQHLNAYLHENPKAEDRAMIEDMRSKIIKGLEAAKK